MRAKTPYKKSKKRVGCGNGSGHGSTSCKGHKGQKARSGYSSRAGFEGGQNPLYRRLPKRGFNATRYREELDTINLTLLDSFGDTDITPETLTNRGIITKIKHGLKVLGSGNVTKAINVKAHAFSASAKEKIEKAGGVATLIED